MVYFFHHLRQIFLNKKNQLIQSRLVTGSVKYSRKLVLPGFDGMPLYDVTEFFIKGLRKGSLSIRAAAFSYNFFLALFPAIIFIFTIIPYIPITGFQDSLLDLMSSFIPKKAYEAVQETLFDIVKRPRGGLLSLGFLMAMYFSTNGIHSLIDSFNQTHHSIESRNWFLIRLVSILLVFILSLLLVLAIVLITLGPIAIEFLSREGIIKDGLGYYLILFGKWLITIALLFFAFSFLYYLAPARRSRFRFVSAGSTVATLLTVATSVGFNYYVNNLSKYNSLYGSIGTLIIVMVWIYFNAMIVLIGFELNVSIQNARRKINS
jgi:membrane protein